MKEGQEVSCNWGKGTANGKVIGVYCETVCEKLQGSEVIRHGSSENPALLVEQQSGDRVLKLQSELNSVS